MIGFDKKTKTKEVKGSTEFRPLTFDDIEGQEDTKNYLKLKVAASKKTGTPLSHSIIAGPSGAGKTTFAQVCAFEIGSRVVEMLASSIKNIDDIIKIVKTLNHGDILFLDECHMLSYKVQVQMYSILEDFQYDRETEGGTERISLPHFTVMGATTHVGELAEAFLMRFPFKATLSPYTDDQLGRMLIKRLEKDYGIFVNGDPYSIECPEAVKVMYKIGSLSRGVPRNSKSLLRNLMEVAEATTSGTVRSEHITMALLKQVLRLEHLDPLLGLDASSRAYLAALVAQDGRPKSFELLANMINVQQATLKDMIEPYMERPGVLKQGDKAALEGCFMVKTAKGRTPTALAIEYVKMCKTAQKSGWFANERLDFE